MDHQTAIGYRFLPTDVDLVSYYLRNKVDGVHMPFTIIEKTLYGEAATPWEVLTDDEPWLNDNEGRKKRVIYVFCKLVKIKNQKRVSRNAGRSSRIAGCGSWEAQALGKPIVSPVTGQVIGHKRSLKFKPNKQCEKEAEGRGEWNMHEFSLPESTETDYVLCRITNKYGDGGKKRKELNRVEGCVEVDKNELLEIMEMECRRIEAECRQLGLRNPLLMTNLNSNGDDGLLEEEIEAAFQNSDDVDDAMQPEGEQQQQLEVVNPYTTNLDDNEDDGLLAELESALQYLKDDDDAMAPQEEQQQQLEVVNPSINLDDNEDDGLLEELESALQNIDDDNDDVKAPEEEEQELEVVHPSANHENDDLLEKEIHSAFEAMEKDDGIRAEEEHDDGDSRSVPQQPNDEEMFGEGLCVPDDNLEDIDQALSSGFQGSGEDNRMILDLEYSLQGLLSSSSQMIST